MPKSQEIQLFRDWLRSSPIARRRFLNWLLWGSVGVAGVTGCGLLSQQNKYSRLENLLQTQQWGAADQETSDLIWGVAGQNGDANSPLYNLEILNSFSCDDLNAIDQLWVKHSEGKFGFSVQVKFWQEIGSPILDQSFDPETDQWYMLSTRVGWRKPVPEAGKTNEDGWLLHWEIAPSPSSPPGMLPLAWAMSGILGSVGGTEMSIRFSSLALRLVGCSRKQS